MLRLSLDRAAVLDKELTMERIAERITQTFGGDDINVMFSDDNAEELVFRIRLIDNEEFKNNEEVRLLLMRLLPISTFEN